jgi:hypothetical protein
MSYQQRTDPDSTFTLGPLRIVWDDGRRLVVRQTEVGNPSHVTEQILAPAYVFPGGRRVPEREAAFQDAERVNAALAHKPCRIARGPLAP